MTATNGKTLYAALAGQSNVSQLSVTGPDGDSGVAHLKSGLLARTDFQKIVITNSAVGASTVDGDSHDRPDKTWWYPVEKKPGANLIDAVKTMNSQISALGGINNVVPIVVWGQGESESNALGTPKSEAGRQQAEQKYIEETQAVFAYMRAHVSQDIQFYILETGRFNTAGALNYGYSQALIDKTNLGLKYVDDAQHKMAQMDSSVHLAVDYDDLPMFADMPKSTPGYKQSWDSDTWHLSYPSKEIVGDRLANYIASDLKGSSPPPSEPPPGPTTVVSGTRGDDVLHGSAQGGCTVNGGTGNDTLYAHGGGNTLNGGAGKDTLYAASGNNTLNGNDDNDVLYGGIGSDLLFGNNGNDTLVSGTGTTTMTGGGGGDIFKFLEATGHVGKITDFHSSVGDKLDISNILDGFDPGSDAIADFVHASKVGSSTAISVDPDGARHFTDLVLLQDVRSFDPDAMLQSKILIV